MHKRFSVLLAGALAILTAPAFAAPPATPESDAHNWTGLYVGVNGGYSWSHGVGMYASTDPSPLPAANPVVSDPAGSFAGITLGANQQIENGLVLGVEGDIDYGDVTASIPDTIILGDTVTTTSDWSGTARGRIGFAAGTIMPYLTAGLAVANSTVTANGGSLSAVLTGWTAGGGVEMKLDDKWSAKIE